MVIALPLTIAILLATVASTFRLKGREIILKDKVITVEIADTHSKQTKGLMYRKYLGENQGMLFTFDKAEKYPFWMHNTLIPLDIIWIDSALNIVDIKENAQPCPALPCDTYYPKVKAKYVLELNGGWVQENNVRIGDSISNK